MIRRSKESDRQAIEQLFLTCFGARWDFLSPFENLDGRYLLFFDDETLVAMTGLIYSEEYMGYEVDWTCTHPKHRHRGYMRMLFKAMLSDVDFEVFCSCWKLPNREKVNLHTLMDMYGFKEVVHHRVHWVEGYNCKCHDRCTLYHGEEGIRCDCFEDLYIRDRKTI